MKKNSNLNRLVDAWRILRSICGDPGCPIEVTQAEMKLRFCIHRALYLDSSLYFTEYPKKNK